MGKEEEMAAKMASEGELGRKWDRCLADSAVKLGKEDGEGKKGGPPWRGVRPVSGGAVPGGPCQGRGLCGGPAQVEPPALTPLPAPGKALHFIPPPKSLPSLLTCLVSPLQALWGRDL